MLTQHHHTAESKIDALQTDFFRYTEFLQKVCGFSLSLNGIFHIENRFRLFCFVIYPIGIFFPMEIVMILYNINNLANLIKVFANTLTHFGICFKMVTYYINRADIFHSISVLKHQKYVLEHTNSMIFVEHKILADKFTKAHLITGSFICVFMIFSVVYFAVFGYRPYEETDIIPFPDFGNNRLGFILSSLNQLIPITTFLLISVGKFTYRYDLRFFYHYSLQQWILYI